MKLLLSGVLLGGQAQAATPVAPGSRAQVCAMATTGMASSFQVPQVRLPNAAVARRINRMLLRDFTGLR